ncbi:group 1 glycosyl transferase [Acidovorax sp. NO-1]|uniref:glycosyltransferase family 4 protein n=1 Tax=Acidovorax sp. NO-1 TaxID=512030 RepID=UPI00023FCA41|nr:glycosyltransferase family 4 protein [Acidovorax sp. NO-1]EHL24502.1 group 1 glycosyl transferase [Acidovorax sp. NO-1]
MIVFIHLLNDRSGSPRVLGHAMQALAVQDPMQLLYLGSGGDGFLGEMVPQARRYAYRRGTNRWATLWAYLRSQWELWRGLRRARDIDSGALLYVNTLLPFAASLYGRLSGRRVVCHLHEVSLRPRMLQWFLLRVATWSAYRVICVSDFQRRRLGLGDLPNVRVVANSVDAAMFDAGMRCVYTSRRAGVFRVCMLCALRDYKGVPEFVELARRFADSVDVEFELVVSDSADAAQRYWTEREALPANLCVRHAVADTSQVYARASLVVNFSRVDRCEETFGLTLLEAMAFGVPVIAPPVGGPAELVVNGVHGYLVDSRNADALWSAVERLAGDEALCQSLSRQCRMRAEALSPDVFQSEIRRAVFDA